MMMLRLATFLGGLVEVGEEVGGEPGLVLLPGEEALGVEGGRAELEGGGRDEGRVRLVGAEAGFAGGVDVEPGEEVGEDGLGVVDEALVGDDPDAVGGHGVDPVVLEEPDGPEAGDVGMSAS